MRCRTTLRGLAALPLAAIVLTASPLVAGGGKRQVFTLVDPAGDDHGGGSLSYPLRSDLNPGDLDLLSLTVHDRGRETVFEATFAEPIVEPERRAIDVGGTTLEQIARLGFYTFNLDIYIDTDRVPGSGEVETLPGRRATVSPAHAWEKAICLTPRPYHARNELTRLWVNDEKEALGEELPYVEEDDERALKRRVERELDAEVFFPTRVRVHGRKVRFTVPNAFLGGAARQSWSYVVLVTGSDIEQRLSLFDGPESGLLGVGSGDPAGLMLLPVRSGRSENSFGGGRAKDVLQPPVVDLIAPADRTQEEQLQDYDLRTNRPVVLVGVVPAAG